MPAMFPAGAPNGMPVVYGQPAVFPTQRQQVPMQQQRPQAHAPVQGPAQPPPQPIVARGKLDDPAELPRSRSYSPVSLPSPEALGIGTTTSPAPRAESVDWANVRTRLNGLGAIGFQLDRLADGSYRFGYVVAQSSAGAPQRIESQGGTEAEAVRLALEKGERGKSPRP